MTASKVLCAGCGWETPPEQALPFRCGNVRPGDDVDHVVTRLLDPSEVRWPTGTEANPFVRYRELFHAYHLGRAHGMSDGEHVDLVERLDKAVASVDGHGFAVTPFDERPELSERLGIEVWVKDETGNVSGSHKGRHLMGLAVHLEVAHRTGRGPGAAELAIASCGNAALAAAVVARAGGRPLRVFVPTWADPTIVDRLEALGAVIEVCPRREGIPGDPTYHRLREALLAGAVPFTCQGPDNGLTVEGGETLGWEMVSHLTAAGTRLDRLFVQVGGGALASSVIRAFEDARALGVSVTFPRVHAVQTEGGHPLARAFDLVAARTQREGIDEAMRYSRGHRSEFMWPWEEEPRSVASGILDDETYDWAVVVEGMLRSGGHPVIVSEEDLEEAHALARQTSEIDVDHTGSAGLAGLLRLRREGAVRPGERVAVLFTGARRG